MRPDDIDLRKDLFFLLLEVFFFDEAEMELETIIAIDPSRIEAYEQLAVVLIRKTRPDGKKALLWLGKA